MKRQGLYLCVYDSDLRRSYCGMEKKTLKHFTQKNNFYVIIFVVSELFGKMVNLDNIAMVVSTMSKDKIISSVFSIPEILLEYNRYDHKI